MTFAVRVDNLRIADIEIASEHTIPAVSRIGAVAWLANVVLRDEERAA